MDSNTPLTDESPFPFGTHKDKKMKDVPAHYLDWFVGQSWSKQWPQVVAYVQDPRTRRAINQDLGRDGLL